MLAAIAFAASLAGGRVSSAQESVSETDVVVSQDSPFVVDPAAGSASGTIHIYRRPPLDVDLLVKQMAAVMNGQVSEKPNEKPPVNRDVPPATTHQSEPRARPVRLHVANFVSTTTTQRLGAKTVISTQPAGSPPPTSQTMVTFDLKDDAIQDVQIQITGLLEAGESTADVLDGTRKIGSVVAVRDRVPFGVVLAGKGEPAELEFEDGEDTWVVFTNNDPLTYIVDWKLRIGGKPASGTKQVPGNGSVAIPIHPNASVFPGYLESALKPRTRDGTLILEYRVAGRVVASKSIPVRAHLSQWGPAGEALASTTLIFLLLVTGTMGSVFVSQIVPISLRRRELKIQVADLLKKSSRLGTGGQSLIRSTVRVELRRTRELLTDVHWYNVDVQTVMSDAVRAINVIRQRIDLLMQIDEVQEFPLPCDNAAPAALRDIERNIKDASRLLGAPDATAADLALAQQYISAARRIKESASKIDSATQEALKKHLQALRDELKAARTDTNYAFIFAEVPALTELMDGADKEPPGDDYVRFQAAVERLEFVARFYRAYKSRPDADSQKMLHDVWQKLAKLLSRDGPAALRAAGLLVCQVREGVYAEQLLKLLEIRPPAARIVVSPRLLSPYDTATFSVVFDNRAFNTSAARESLLSSWTFPIETGKEGKGVERDKESVDAFQDQGWSIPHYFTSPGKHQAVVSFRDPLRMEEGEPSKPVELPPVFFEVVDSYTQRGLFRSLLEAGRLLLLIFIALAALVGGVRNEIVKLDPFAAIIAVLGIGYAANGVKNLFSPPAASTPQPGPGGPGPAPQSPRPTVPPGPAPAPQPKPGPVILAEPPGVPAAALPAPAPPAVPAPAPPAVVPAGGEVVAARPAPAAGPPTEAAAAPAPERDPAAAPEEGAGPVDQNVNAESIPEPTEEPENPPADGTEERP